MCGYFRELKITNMKKILFFLSFVIFLSVVSSCYKDNLAELTAPINNLPGGTACDTLGVMLYTANVVPVLQANCGTNNLCHGPHNGSDFDLSTYTSVRAVVKSGQMMSCISWTGSATRMPLGGKQLTICNITKIQKWINAGTLNN